MEVKEYKQLVKKYRPKENRTRNFLVAFLCGGIIGFCSETFCMGLLILGLSRQTCYLILCISMIFLSCLFTALGFFDNFVSKCKCGLIIPTTGFAHSVASSTIEYKKDGFITGMGSNFFKLAGSVIFYGIISSFFFCVMRVVIGV